METVGTRELKRNHSEYLRSVKTKEKSSNWFEKALPMGQEKNLAEWLPESDLKGDAVPKQLLKTEDNRDPLPGYQQSG
jgi:hypothetical protein